MKVKEYFKEQIEHKPANSDTFTVFAFEAPNNILKLAVDINDLDEFYNRVESRDKILGYHENTAIPFLEERT